MLTPELFAKATEPVDHPWFQVDAGVPVILGAGVFCEQKDFATLIRAFARLRALRPTRLVILGNGPERPALQKLAQSLGIDKDVDMPGFVDNPYSYMARANLFTLSSAWEGFGNVLAEAMGLGTPLVATDCPNGPSEILDGGRLGRLVPVGDDKALAKAMEETLLSPPRPEILRDAARRFAVDDIAAQYREALGI
jgi:glycosyltransferase involved in cell wall biosynthesis